MIFKQNDPVIEWLLEDSDPSMAYHAYHDLCGYDANHEKIRVLKKDILVSQPVQTILAKMHPDGYWLQQNERTKQWVGDGVEYGSFATTHFCLSYLAELGLDKSNEQVSRAAERYLDLQKDDGDWWNHFACLLGYNIRTLIRLGYRNDQRLQRSIDLLLTTTRKDNGYLCDIHEKKNQAKKSCIRGSVKALLAFSELPEYWQHPRCLGLVDYFLNRNGIFKVKNRNEYVNDDMTRFSFPITWRANVWEILLALSKMGYGHDERLIDAWKALEQKKDEHGKYILDWTPTQCPWKVGKRGAANKWITFYVLLAYKYKNQLFTQNQKTCL